MNKEIIEELKTLNVDVVAVSKYHTKEEIDEVAKCGLITFGENKVQDFLDKYDPNYKWHMIGHLQTNKVKYLMGKIDLIESVDSIKLAKEINKQATKHNLIQDILVQIKISKDENKTGISLNDLDDLLKEIESYKHLNLKGFMCVASNTDDINIITNEFMQMKSLFEKYKHIYKSIDTLSMGMSGDYKIAIDCGSTLIRVGNLIFN